MAGSTIPGGLIDSCVFHDWATKAELGPYMPPAWRELLVDRVEITSKLRASTLYANPLGNKDLAAYPEHGPPGSDPELLIEQLLGAGTRERVVLGYDDAILTTAVPPYIARTVVQAANEWTAEKWLTRDERLYGLIMIANELPEDAAVEIKRAGANDRMVGIAMGANGMGKPFGHPVYHPIYRAASELGLPIVIQVGSDTAASLTTWPIAGGLAATYGEYRALGAHALMSHVASLIVEAVFELFPDLKVLLIGGGVSWVPGYVWRLNYWYKLNQHEAPWLKRLPSDYFRDHIHLSTYSLETTRPVTALTRALQTVPWFDSNLIYTSGYPNVDWEEPEAIADRLPESWHENMFRTTRWACSVGQGRRCTLRLQNASVSRSECDAKLHRHDRRRRRSPPLEDRRGTRTISGYTVGRVHAWERTRSRLRLSSRLIDTVRAVRFPSRGCVPARGRYGRLELRDVARPVARPLRICALSPPARCRPVCNAPQSVLRGGRMSRGE